MTAQGDTMPDKQRHSEPSRPHVHPGSSDHAAPAAPDSAHDRSSSPTHDAILTLQRATGNQHVQRALAQRDVPTSGAVFDPFGAARDAAQSVLNAENNALPGVRQWITQNTALLRGHGSEGLDALIQQVHQNA